MPVKRMFRNGAPSAIRSTAAPVANPTGRRITRCEWRYQKPLRSARASRAIASFQRRGPPALTRSPSMPSSAGSSVSETRGGDQRAQHPADAHRVQEALAEDDQRRQRRRHRDRAEGHHAARGAQRRPQRRLAVRARGQLLAEAADHEQRVVDRQPQPEPVDQVQGVDRHRVDLVVDHPDGEEASAGSSSRRPPAAAAPRPRCGTRAASAGTGSGTRSARRARCRPRPGRRPRARRSRRRPASPRARSASAASIRGRAPAGSFLNVASR